MKRYYRRLAQSSRFTLPIEISKNWEDVKEIAIYFDGKKMVVTTHEQEEEARKLLALDQALQKYAHVLEEFPIE